NVINGPPNGPGCWPVVTTTPAVAARINRSRAAPLGESAGSRSRNHVFDEEPRTASSRSRHSPEVDGVRPYHSDRRPACAARESGEPPSGSLTTRGSLTDVPATGPGTGRGSLVVWLV